jgi:hypothetical protein
MRLGQATLRKRLLLEVLEDRTTPSNGNFPPGQFPSGNPAQSSGGVFSVDPAGNAETHTVAIQQQVTSIILPSGTLPNGNLVPTSGEVLPGHGLKTAEAHTPVIDWTPT